MTNIFTRRFVLRPMAAALLASLAASSFAQSVSLDDDASTQTVLISGSDVAQKTAAAGVKEGLSADEIAVSTNVMTTEDALKYFPAVLVRKRFIGDTMGPMASRTVGVNASARTLIFADGMLLSALVNNNNGNGSPQWFMVSPEEIAGIDVMYGPYSAAYAGNSYGAVAQIHTRMPTQFEATARLSVSSQDFNLYGSSKTYRSGQLNATIGNRNGGLSWFVSASHLDSQGQPISFGTVTQSSKLASAGDPVLTGAFADRNRTGGAILVLGSGNETHTVQDNAKLKLVYEFSSELSLGYVLGFWQNSARTTAASYLSDKNGLPYFGAASGTVNIGGYAYSASTIAGQFASGNTQQEHRMQNLSLQTHHQSGLNWELAASNMSYGKDLTRTSTGVYPAAANGGAGRLTDAAGTGWTTLDLKGSWSASEPAEAQQLLSFGIHSDTFRLASPVYNLTDWLNGSAGSLSSNSQGRTQTNALWLQDDFKLNSQLFASLGVRYEDWQAYQGFNYALAANGSAYPVYQPSVRQSGWSPKASLSWLPVDQWSVTASLGKALRFPTVGELYQNIQTGATYTQANPYLKPESVLAGELALERKTADSRVRVSLFEEFVSDALIAQTSTVAGYAAPVSFTQNVDKTRQRGIELVAEKRDVLIKGLELSGSITFVDAVILANKGYVPTISGATSVGKHTPYVPDLRATLVATYRPDAKWAYTLAGRYTGTQYGTVDNSDVNSATYQGFQGFFVADARVQYLMNQKLSFAAGIDNLNNRKYYLYHPFAQRSMFAELKYTY